jgi:hypothetical protein
MDLNTFKAGMNARLSELNDNEEGLSYYLGSDPKIKLTDYQCHRRFQDVRQATISVTCHDGAKLARRFNTNTNVPNCGSSGKHHTQTMFYGNKCFRMEVSIHL